MLVETLLFFLSFLSVTSFFPYCRAVAAFPSAVGFGSVASGGRGGSVVHVTNLNDAGPGSFRDAVSASGRTIVFDVGGYINLTTAVSVKGDITIAGQTAPGEGVGIMGREVSFAGSSNIIVRYMRFRQGDLDKERTKSSVSLLDAKNVIFDHCSVQFGQWNNIDSVGASNVTFQYVISADPIGQQFGAHTETGPYTWYRCIFANAHNRCPLAKDNTQFINSILYNFQAGYTAGNSQGIFKHDVVGNYFITGPSSTEPKNAFFQMNTQEVFINDTYEDSSRDGTLHGSPMGQPVGTTRLATPWNPTTHELATLSADQAYHDVIANVGASLHRDSVDNQLINTVTSLGKAGSLIKSQRSTGLPNDGYGTLVGGIPPADTDRDGMPDDWELLHRLNPQHPDNNGYHLDEGYTNLEVYLNCLVGEGECNTKIIN